MIVTAFAIRHSGLEPESSPRRLHTDRGGYGKPGTLSAPYMAASRRIGIRVESLEAGGTAWGHWTDANTRKGKQAMQQSMEESRQPGSRRSPSVKQWAIAAAVVVGAILLASMSSPWNGSRDTNGTFFVSVEGEPPLILKPEAKGYNAARAELEAFQADAPGTHSVSLGTYLSIKAALGLEDDKPTEGPVQLRNLETRGSWADLLSALACPGEHQTATHHR